jgi:hypothetical protein
VFLSRTHIRQSTQEKKPVGGKWIIPVMILVVLITAYAFRFNIEATKSIATVVMKWECDRWTGDLWLKVYGFSETGTVTRMTLADKGLNKDEQKREQKALHKRKLLTYIWLALLIADSAWLTVVLIRRHKNKPYDPILETYKKIFPE